MAQIAADGGFLEWKLGRPFEPSPDRFEPTKRASEHLLRQRVMVGGRPADRVTFEVDGELLSEVELFFSAEGEQAVDELLTWGREVCAPFTDRLEFHIPSPLGTPEPGKEWDPAQIEMADCGGEAHGVRYRISLQRNWAKDFHNGYVSVRLKPRSSR